MRRLREAGRHLRMLAGAGDARPKFRLGNSVQRHVCEKVLERTHEKCRVVPDTEPCNGVAKVVTITEYQQAIAGGEGAPTYEPSALEKAKRSMQATWVCVTSLFNDC